jgi:hypothetical protein
MSILVEPIIISPTPLRSERPTCDTRGCKNLAIGYEKIGGWELRLCPEHASTELLRMKPGEEFEKNKEYRYRYERR